MESRTLAEKKSLDLLDGPARGPHWHGCFVSHQTPRARMNDNMCPVHGHSHQKKIFCKQKTSASRRKSVTLQGLKQLMIQVCWYGMLKCTPGHSRCQHSAVTWPSNGHPMQGSSCVWPLGAGSRMRRGATVCRETGFTGSLSRSFRLFSSPTFLGSIYVFRHDF